MKIKVKTQDLKKGLQLVRSVIPTKGILPEIESILLTVGDKLEIYGTDFECGIKYPVDYEGEGDCKVVVSTKIVDILKNVKDEFVTLEYNEHFHVKFGKSKYKIPTFDAENYPAIPSGEDWEDCRLNITQIIPCVSQETHKGMLTGVYMNGDEIAATDGYRVSVSKQTFPHKVIVPLKSLLKVKKLGNEFMVSKKSNIVFFDIDGIIINTRLLEGRFPNYKNLIPETFKNTIYVNRELLIESLDRMGTFKTNDISTVKFNIDNKELKLSANSDDGSGEETIGINSDVQLEIQFNGKYLNDFLKTSKTETLQIDMNGQVDPILIRDINTVCLVMPIRP